MTEFDHVRIEEIKKVDNWPVAIDPGFVVTTEEQRITRAEAVLYLFFGNVLGTRFLDFGCGEGHVAEVAARKGAKIAVGYDLVSQAWDHFQHGFFTTNFADVQGRAPYDNVLLYDVLDHAKDPVQVLRQIKTVLAPGGTVYVRVHPWCSRHGGHVFKVLNKSFAHFCLSDELLDHLSEHKAPNQRVIHPFDTYHGWLRESGWKIMTEDVVSDRTLEEIFRKSAFFRYWIQQQYKDSPKPEYRNLSTFPQKELEIQFIDFSLQL